jgi:hAT family C-terminal dimerisation region
MFNTLDEVDKGLTASKRKRSKDSAWIEQLKEASLAMRDKLKQYFTDADHFVFSEAILLDPSTKAILFESESYKQHSLDYKTIYIDRMRDRFESQYANRNVGDTASTVTSDTRKRKTSDDPSNDFNKSMLEAMSTATPGNELDRYLQVPLSSDSVSTLVQWKHLQHEFPHLAMMAWDVYAVPASSAGVEWEFSKGGKIAIPSRARLNSDTIEQSMMYKSYLVRTGKPIEEPEADWDDSNQGLGNKTLEFCRQYKW